MVFRSRWHARFTYSPSPHTVHAIHFRTSVLYHCRFLHGNSKFTGLWSRSHCTNVHNPLTITNINKNKLLWAMSGWCFNVFDDATVLSPLDTLNLLFVVRLLKSSSSRSIIWRSKIKYKLFKKEGSVKREGGMGSHVWFERNRIEVYRSLCRSLNQTINIRKWEILNFNTRCWGRLFFFVVCCFYASSLSTIKRNLFQFLRSLPIEEGFFSLLFPLFFYWWSTRLICCEMVYLLGGSDRSKYFWVFFCLLV